MFLSKILDELKIEYNCFNEKEITSLGLVSYNNSNKRVLIFVEKELFIKLISDSVSMVLTNKELEKKVRNQRPNLGVAVVENPRITFFKTHNYLSQNKTYAIDKCSNIIGRKCKISNKATIADNNVFIGNNVTIEENVIVRDNVTIGDNVVIRAGCIIGGEGFEFKRDNGELLFVNHIGSVKIGNNVHIQYNTCIDKAIYPWDSTVIGHDVAIDNFVHIAHAVKVGDGTLVVANSGIGGRTEIGKDSWIGFGCTIRNGIKIGNNARVNMGAVVTADVADNEAVSGNFAIRHDLLINNIKDILRQ